MKHMLGFGLYGGIKAIKIELYGGNRAMNYYFYQYFRIQVVWCQEAEGLPFEILTMEYKGLPFGIVTMKHKGLPSKIVTVKHKGLPCLNLKP